MNRLTQAVKPLVPMPVRKSVRSGLNAAKRRIARKTGTLPDFVVVGGQKCGTTSVYHYLKQNPYFHFPPKEIGFFTHQVSDDIGWYRSHFPSFIKKWHRRYLLRMSLVSGDVDPAYILDPHALQRISNVIPKAKIILLLRNPVDRAYSHYHHCVRDGIEKLSFEDALQAEPERVDEQWRKMISGQKYDGLKIYRFSYIKTGVYVDQVNALLNIFPRQQILFLEAENLFKDPNMEINKILNFLCIPEWQLKRPSVHNQGSYRKMEDCVREKLIDYFRPFNQDLYDLIGKFDWDR